MKRLANWLGFGSGRVTSTNARPATPDAMQALEERVLMAAGPRVKDIFADNRGQVTISIDRALNGKTVTKNSVQIYAVGKNGTETLKDSKVSFNKKKNQIVATAKLKANGVYKVKLNSRLIKGTDGARLDGEFKGATKTSGNGKAGGDYVVKTKAAGKNIARFQTTLGIMDVEMFTRATPKTVANFLYYANRGDWDGTFFHRSVKDFIIQGGGFEAPKGDPITSTNQPKEIPAKAAVQNEPHPGKPGNVRGTIAMAKLGGDPNSATNQWFFNLGDNRTNLDNQNGGFTAFGKVTNKSSLAVMDKIAAKQTVNASGVVSPTFGELPVVSVDAVIQAQQLKKKDLLFVNRLAMKMDVISGATAKKAKAPAERRDSGVARKSLTVFSQTPVQEAGLFAEEQQALLA